MSALRRLLTNHRCLAGLLIAFALIMKVVLPAGTMIATDHRAITVALCSGTGAETMTMTMTMVIPMKPGHQQKDAAKAEMPCAFAGLGLAALPAVDAILLAGLILFIVTTALRTVRAAPTMQAARLRPPLRGPPVTA